MKRFKKIISDIYVLEVPFGNVWTGVILIRGEQNILIDSGPNAESVEEYIIPALDELGLQISDIDLLLNTHCHGDHVGGHSRVVKEGVSTATFEQSLDKIRNPLKYSKLIRSVYPAFSPPAPKVLDGIEPDTLVKEGEIVAGRLRLISSPGHDTDTVCWYDEKTKTLLSGDTLQGNGTIGQGIGLYMDVDQYRSSIEKLLDMDIENIILSHDYLPLSSAAMGKDASRALLRKCLEILAFYDASIKEITENGCTVLVDIARKLIEAAGGMQPDYMFLALYTTETHLKCSKIDYMR